ncbi:MAG: hypothetical protein IPP25_08625 [Saprospiraceae bacterium]|nr:hypothetical protein [Candidatus Opimibacter skivensis]
MIKPGILSIYFILHYGFFSAQTPTWQLWASGLPTGVYPRMTVAPNHDIFYTLLGAGSNLGYIYKANTQDATGDFNALPIIPRPATIQNNIVALGCNKWSEPLAGIYRSEINDPWLFRYDLAEGRWDTATAPFNPTLGGHCIATSPDGTIYVGTRWANIYKSNDDGRTFEIIDETQAVQSAYPCYYPTWNGSIYDGAIFSIQVDRNGRVYAGTETAGVIYSDDQGVNWHPADFFACRPEDNTMKDSNSAMIALAMSGNVAGLGFTHDNQLIWTGADMWTLGWKNKMGYADMDLHTVSEVQGLPDYLIQTGQQVSRIVTTDQGQMFFHSGSSNGATEIGIYTSWDGINWSLFNDGITGANDGLSQGSLAVDGNKVFMATMTVRYGCIRILSGFPGRKGVSLKLPGVQYIQILVPIESAFNLPKRSLLKTCRLKSIVCLATLR